MDIVVHDFAGHPFPLQLSRRLARKGHQVHHLHCASVIGAKGQVEELEGDLERLSIEGLSTARPIAKASFLRRFADECRYGHLAADRISEIDPEVVLCANTPLDSLRLIQNRCAKSEIKFVNWLQDINSLAVADILPGKIPILGRPVAAHYLALEKSLLHRADHIVPVSDDFEAWLQGIGIAPRGYTVIENWAPLDEMPARPRRNGWGRRHGLDGSRNVIYSGNLGFKHNPDLLVDLAKAMGETDPRYRLVVVSEGVGADRLSGRQAALNLPSLLVLPFQPYGDVPEMMASADVLLALLEPQERPYCVPSKVLSYCCSGRPVVLSADPGNLASRIVSQNRCGRVVGAGDAPALIRAVLELLADEGERAACGGSARRYAEAAFPIEPIAARFEAVLKTVLS